MNNRILMITGTSRGIGENLARYYLSKGFYVVGCSRSDAKWYDAETYPAYTHFTVDIGNESDVKGIFSHIRKKYGRLDYLINNAGRASMNHSLLTPASAVDDILHTNTLGTFICCREAAKIMRKNHFGRIVNFVTVAIPLKLMGESVYAASKAAVLSLTQILAKEYADFGITVNAVGPTPVQTNLIKNVPTEKIEQTIAHQAIRRYGTYADVENVVDFFICDNSEYITGQVIYLGGI